MNRNPYWWKKSHQRNDRNQVSKTIPTQTAFKKYLTDSSEDQQQELQGFPPQKQLKIQTHTKMNLFRVIPRMCLSQDREGLRRCHRNTGRALWRRRRSTRMRTTSTFARYAMKHSKTVRGLAGTWVGSTRGRVIRIKGRCKFATSEPSIAWCSASQSTSMIRKRESHLMTSILTGRSLDGASRRSETT